jgi:HlyD family secretion protein
VREGQKSSFTVDAYPGYRFPATVRQVRNAPMTLENVVTYDVVLDVDNREGRLKPGMTANVSVIVGEADDVLKVPTAALRFRPPADAADSGDATASRLSARKVAAGESLSGTVYRLERGEPVELPVEVGLADDASTAVTSPTLAPGDRIITRIRPETEPSTGFSFFGGPGRPR